MIKFLLKYFTYLILFILKNRKFKKNLNNWRNLEKEIMIVSYNSQIKKLSFKQKILFSLLQTISVIQSNKFKNNKTVKKISKNYYPIN